MKRKLVYILFIILGCLLTGCIKNELTLEGKISGSEGRQLRIVYRAADRVKSFLVDNPMPMGSEGSFSLKVATRYPTVLWIFAAADGSLLLPVYAERGDELKLSGNFAEPWAWTVSGNKVMEQYCEWAKANEKLLRSGEADKINAAVAKYVHENPDSRTAAFMIFTRFEISGHEAEYKKLVSSLTLDEDDLAEMQAACMALACPEVNTPAKAETFSLPDNNDSIQTINPATPKKMTLLYFWREKPMNEEQEILTKAVKDTTLQVVTIYMDTDDQRLEQTLNNDSAMKAATSLRALGGEVNPALRKLGVSGSPYFIVTDNSGKIKYRGDTPSEVRKQILK